MNDETTVDEVCLRVAVTVQPPVTTGSTPLGESRLLTFEDGTFEGPDLRGVVLPGGTDWQRLRDDGVLEIRAHYLLRTDQGEVIEVVSEGLRSAPPEVMQRLAAGEKVAQHEYYLRTFMRLTTASPRLEHFNRHLYYGTGQRRGSTVEITVRRIP